MGKDQGLLSGYPCGDYLASTWVSDGFWDESAQLWLLEPAERVVEHPDLQFLQIGRPGVDDIGFGYRADHAGFWAYHPAEGRFQLLAPSLAAFMQGWAAGTIAV